MRPRPLLWLLVSALCFAGAFYFWRLGDRWAAQRHPARSTTDLAPTNKTRAAHGSPLSPFNLLTQAGTLNSAPATEPVTNNAAAVTNRFALRLSNTTAPMRELQRSDRAILLENALLDTAQPVPAIPEHLRAQGDPGA